MIYYSYVSCRAKYTRSAICTNPPPQTENIDDADASFFSFIQEDEKSSGKATAFSLVPKDNLAVFLLPSAG